MRTRDIRVRFRLNQTEYEDLIKNVNLSGMKVEVYLREIIKGNTPRQKPPPDYYSMMKELNYIGHNLNQIAMQANFNGAIDAEKYEVDAALLRKALLHIQAAVELSESEKSID